MCRTPDPEDISVVTGKSGLLPAWSEEISLRDDVVGVSLRHPAEWIVTHDDRLFETYGFMLRAPDLDSTDLHGPLPVARVALDHSHTAADLEAVVQRKIDEYAGVPMKRHVAMIGGRRAIVLGPVPGGQVSTNVYLTEGDRLYRINYYADSLDAVGRALIESMAFEEPARNVESLGLRRMEDFAPVGLGDEVPKRGERSIASTSFALEAEDPCDSAISVEAVSATEVPLDNGCWAQPGDFFIQTTHSWDANGTGWSRMGTPNFWGERTHGDWGLGRCVSTYYTNDLYAIDYYLNEGDRLFSPFRAGYVQYAGWDPENWWNYGNMVVIASPNGKFWSLSAHLSYVNVAAGQSVDEDTLIGWAGSTGYAAPYPHVHQVFYRWASSSFGRPYGGAGLRQTKLSYLGNGGGAYTSFAKDKWASW